MALTIRCTQCSRKISVDEAFAGGVCRCPYCKAIVPVAASPAADGAARPASPSRPAAPSSRPLAPGQGTAGVEGPAGAQAPAAHAQPAAIADHAHVPTARPVMFQGVMTIVFLGLLVAVVAAAIVLWVVLSKQEPAAGPGAAGQAGAGGQAGQGVGVPDGGSSAAPVEGSASAAGLAIAPPVIYVVDNGNSMARGYDYAIVLTRMSLRTLDSGQRFNILVARQTGVEPLDVSMLSADGPGQLKAAQFLGGFNSALGATDVAEAIEMALKLKPASVVVLARKPLDDPAALGAKAAAAGAKIYAIGVNADPQAAESLEKLAQASGGRSRTLSASEIDDIISSAEPLD